MEKDFLTTLLDKEKELQEQLKGLRSTIGLFNNGSFKTEVDSSGGTGTPMIEVVIPKDYEEILTWNQRIYFALGKMGNAGFVEDIATELAKHMPLDQNTLKKRITAIASAMKAKKLLGAKKIGIRYKYFVK